MDRKNKAYWWSVRSSDFTPLTLLNIMFHARMRRFQLELIYYFTYFSTIVPSNSCVFLSCRLSSLIQHFQQVLWVMKFLLSPGLGSWQLEFKSVIIVICDFQKFLFVAWPGLLISEFKSLMRGEVCILGNLVLRWHHWAGIWRRSLLVFRSLQVCLFFYSMMSSQDKMPNIQSTPHISDLKSKINSLGQATNKNSKF